MQIRVGIGYDVHKLVYGRDLFIGGVKIPYEKGLLGHSDADVLIHAIIDSLLGASSLGDIGKLFPDNQNEFKDIDSKILLAKSWDLIKSSGWFIENIDTVVICQKPKILPYVDEMKKTLSSILSINVDQIGIKGKTTETLGFEGREEGISAHSVALLSR